jgi:hypothetical protein
MVGSGTGPGPIPGMVERPPLLHLLGRKDRRQNPRIRTSVAATWKQRA